MFSATFSLFLSWIFCAYKGAIVQVDSSRRVRTIYSVIASPNRLDILRILNTKGPLSVLWTQNSCWFQIQERVWQVRVSLAKVVKQTLISLNRAERKYTVTSLGRLVLNLTKQIEEQSMLESGKLYVRELTTSSWGVQRRQDSSNRW